jgi:hypothetical protein
MLDPVALIALATLILNDHILKSIWPGIVTGKLSDIAGLVVCPIFMFGLWEVIQFRLGDRGLARRRAILVAAAITGLGFALVKISPAGAEAYRLGFGVLNWPFQALSSALHGMPFVGLQPALFAQDASDLLMLPVLLVPVWLVTRRV